MHIEVVTIGDELLLGYTIDTNAAYIARVLAVEGVEITRRTTVGDTAPAIAAAVREALDRTGAVITTGGLGPTSDDLTKPSIAALFGRAMVLDEEHLAWMEERFTRIFQRPMAASNRQQAMLPAGARKLRNNHGSAPGIWLEDERGRWVAMLPGVPRELRGMLADTLVPLVRERSGAARRVVRSRTLRTTGVGESLIADRVATLADGVGDVDIAYLPNPEGTDLRLTVRGAAPEDADRRLADSAARLHTVLDDAIYGEDDADLAAVVLDLCRTRSLTIAVAESCTGGLLGARLTAIPGSSDVLLGGVIAYANAVKTTLLGVPAAMLREHGAVSEPVVRAMASGARAATGARVGLAITGVAGPGGGTDEKPVGTVWIATDVEGEIDARKTRLIGDRAEVRQRAAQAILEMLRRRLAPGRAPVP
ncbi:MAG TPA: competence/damage-inducible protein A [Gemmatimonadaceae bacterium]|jgi:nicotinamide-nucleotide amidase|nr:competence/damage-inducible protein A [Gemmatimonadaceae bacterium]